MRWIKVSDDYYVDIDELAFVYWRYWEHSETKARMKALDVYFKSGKALSLEAGQGEMLVTELEVRRENAEVSS